MDRVLANVRSRLQRAGPVRLLWAALALAAVAVAGFLLLAHLGASPVARSGETVPPSWAGAVATLDAQGVYDSDSDGLADALENLVYGSDPADADTSGTGVPDGWLARYGFDPVDPAIGARPAAVPKPSDLPSAYKGVWPAEWTATLADTYAHGRPADWNESRQGPFDNGLDPRRWDSAQPGIADAWAIRFGVDLRQDGILDKRLAGPEGLSVREAYRHRADPRALDTDLDGLPDRVEVEGAPNPRPGVARFPPSDPSRADTAGTGVCDGYLVSFGLDPTRPEAAGADLDRDGASTREEHDWSRGAFGAEACKGRGADPTKARSGASEIPDGWLLRHGLDPFTPGLDARRTQGSLTDPRPAGLAAGTPPVNLTVLQEYRVNRPADWDEARSGPWWGGTRPDRDDTDGDGLGDAWEIAGLLVTATADPNRPEPQAHRATSDPTKPDTDGDGLDDLEEADPSRRPSPGGNRTDPRRWDTDFDGIDDGTETGLGLGLDPTRADSVNDLLPDGRRLGMLRERAAAALTSDAYGYPGEPGRQRGVSEWLASAAGAAALAKPLSPAARASLLGPAGDLDADGVANVRDKDIDNDTLLNGWEAIPDNYQASPFGRGEFADGRPATDPLNADTDGDSLRDDWEVRHGDPDYRVSRYNLDPARWNSDAEAEAPGEARSDDKEDPDDDGVTWRSFAGGSAVVATERFTNADEQAYRTDPNDPDSDGDTLRDGWKAFWGLKYPAQFPQEVLPGAPRPVLGLPQADVVVQQGSYVRFVLDAAARQPHEQARQPVSVRDPSDLSRTRTVVPLEGTMALTFPQVQAAGTNPYRPDTDLDGLPDWWEVLHAGLLPGLDPGGECINAVGPSPVEPDALADPDADGLDNAQELASGTDPLCGDSDAGGIRDGQEHLFGLDPMVPTDDQTLLINGADTDGDGILDFEEITGIRSIDYRSYLGAGEVRTRFDQPDTDGDGLLDGRDVPDANQQPNGLPAGDARTRRWLDLGIAYYRTPQGGYVFLGERPRTTDPRDGDDAGIGVPSGWLAAHNIAICTVNVPGCTPTEARWAQHYALARPPWWDLAKHGPWWGGARPTDDLVALRGNVDLDRDGLRDRDGADGYEDPMPAVNPGNEWRAVDYTGHGLRRPAAHPAEPGLDPDADPQAWRMLAQSFLSPRVLNPTHYTRDAQASDPTPRGAPCLLLDAGVEGATLVKGQPHEVSGRLAASCDAGAPPVPRATVEGRLGTPAAAHGAGFTDAAGRFRFNITLAGEHNVSMPPAGHLLRGNTSGTVRWVADPSRVPVGPTTLLLRSYATTLRLPGEPSFAPALVPVPVTVQAGTRIEVSAPANVQLGSEFTAQVRVTDSAGSPLQRRLDVQWLGQGGDDPACAGVCVQTRSDGTAELILRAPAGAQPGVHELVARADAGQHVAAGEGRIEVVVQRAIDVAFTAPPATADAGTSLVLRGRVGSAAGGVPGVPVRLTLTLAGQERTTLQAQTSASGSFQFAVPLTADSPPGAYLATASVAASNTTQAGQAQASVAVRSLPRFMAVDLANLTLGKAATVAARLVEPDGARGVPNALVTIELDGQRAQARTDSDGRFAASLVGTLPLHPVRQRLAFAGDAAHQATQDIGERTVQSGTTLHVPPGVASRGRDTELQAVLQDGAGRPLAGQPVGISWAGESARTVLTGADGVARMVRRGDPSDGLGLVAVRASFPGAQAGGLAPSFDQAGWTVRAAPELVLPNGTFAVGDRLPAAQLRDAVTRQPLAGREVTVRVEDAGSATTHQATTDDAGRLQVPLPAGAAPRSLGVWARFAGDDLYGPATNESVIDRRAPTALGLRVPDAVIAGRETVVLAQVTDAAGLPVGAGEVQLMLAGLDAGRWPVADGLARIALRLPPEHPTGAAALQADYLGSPSHLPSARSASLLVLAPVEMRVEAVRVAPGETASVRVAVTSAGAPLPFTQVSLAVGGLGSGLVATTDRDGVATFQLEQGADDMPVAARFAGDGQLGPAMAQVTLAPADPASLAERRGMPLAWTAAAAAAVLLALSGVAARLRAQPLEAAFRRVQDLLAGPADEQTVLLAFRILEDAVIGRGLLLAPARTAGELHDALRPSVPTAAHAPLAAFIRLFEDARYGPRRLQEPERAHALRSLQQVLGALEARVARGGA